MNDKGYANPQLLISVEELMRGFDDGSICLVDVRPTHEYVEGHIPGAIHLDLFAISLNDTSEKAYNAFMWMISYLFKDRGSTRQRQSYGTKMSLALRQHADSGSASI